MHRGAVVPLIKGVVAPALACLLQLILEKHLVKSVPCFLRSTGTRYASVLSFVIVQDARELLHIV